MSRRHTCGVTVREQISRVFVVNSLRQTFHQLTLFTSYQYHFVRFDMALLSAYCNDGSFRQRANKTTQKKHFLKYFQKCRLKHFI